LDTGLPDINRMPGLDIQANRRAAKWTPAALAGRALWGLAQPLFAWSPRICWSWRNSLLRLFGARIGAQVHIHPSVRIAVPWNLDIGDHAAVGDRAILYSLGPISIGEGTCVSQYAHLCAGTHDHRRADFPLVKAPIVIEDGVWICADAFVGPDVRVASHAIVAARAVVTRDVPAWTIVGGHPAVTIGPRPPLETDQ
jgi:putative colanic acid biosynthesis acetyltransferase WcaF